MKNMLAGILLLCLLTAACSTNDDEVQAIDQVTDIYIDSAGIDMLNSALPHAYSTLKINDVDGLTDTAPVSFQLLRNDDNGRYRINYSAGARRIATDSTDATHKTYRSRLALIFSKSIDSTSVIIHDTLQLNYSFTPELFVLQSAYYNKKKIFEKIPGQPNTVTVYK